MTIYSQLNNALENNYNNLDAFHEQKNHLIMLAFK